MKAEVLPPLAYTMRLPEPEDTLDFDELYFVGRGQRRCRLLWGRVSKSYRTGLLYNNFWRASAKTLRSDQHRPTDKGNGETS